MSECSKAHTNENVPKQLKERPGPHISHVNRWLLDATRSLVDRVELGRELKHEGAVLLDTVRALIEWNEFWRKG